MAASRSSPPHSATPLSVPLVDLAAQGQALRDRIEAYVEQVMARGDFVLGSAVGELEKRLATTPGLRQQ